MHKFETGDGGVGLLDVEWCECSAVERKQAKEGRVASDVRGRRWWWWWNESAMRVDSGDNNKKLFLYTVMIILITLILKNGK